MEEVKKVEEIKEIEKKVGEIVKLDEVRELLKSNEVKFEFEETTYKVRKPTFQEKQEIYKKRVEKFTELLSNDKYLLEIDLKALYLKRNIDIDDINKKINKLAQDRENLMVKLGQAIKDKAPENELNLFKTEIEKYNVDISNFVNQRNSYLEFSLENQVVIFSYTYLTFLVTEKKIIGKDLGEGKKEDDSWVRAWNSWEEYEKAPEALINRASYFATIMGGIEAEV